MDTKVQHIGFVQYHGPEGIWSLECTHPGRPRDALAHGERQLEGNQSVGPQAYGNADRVSISLGPRVDRYSTQIKKAFEGNMVYLSLSKSVNFIMISLLLKQIAFKPPNPHQVFPSWIEICPLIAFHIIFVHFLNLIVMVLL